MTRTSVLSAYIVEVVPMRDTRSPYGNVTIMATLSNQEIVDVTTFFADEIFVDAREMLGHTVEAAASLVRRQSRSNWGLRNDEPMPAKIAPMSPWSPSELEF